MKHQSARDWTDVVARKLRESEESVADGCWERLERELPRTLSRAEGGDSGVSTKNKRRFDLIRYTAAAAAILVCVSIGVRVLRIDHNVIKKGVVSVSEATVGGNHEGAERSSDAAPSFDNTLRKTDDVVADAGDGRVAERVKQQVPEGGVQTESQQSASETDVWDRLKMEAELALTAEPDGEEVAQVIPEGKEESNPAVAETVDAGEKGDVSSQVSGSETLSTQGESSLAEEYERLFADATPVVKCNRGSIALFGVGTVGTQNAMGGVAGGGIKALPMNTCEAIAVSEGYESYSFDHKQPLSFGLSYRHEFKYGLSLESGLNYTLLRSDVSLPGNAKKMHQQLHLLGIPLRMNWEFLHVGRFSMYVGAGGMVERCVSARLGKERVDENTWLWSVAGTLGAQYRLGRHVGIYFEPALSHYLNHTSLQTAYTDSPLMLDLRLGLRFSY